MPTVYSYDGKKRVEYIEAEPVCGRDFCDNCGDCIYCYGDDCNTNDYCGGWSWILYEGSDDELIAELKAIPQGADA